LKPPVSVAQSLASSQLSPRERIVPLHRRLSDDCHPVRPRGICRVRLLGGAVAHRAGWANSLSVSQYGADSSVNCVVSVTESCGAVQTSTEMTREDILLWPHGVGEPSRERLPHLRQARLDYRC